jgi:hypothetical protein
MARPHHGHGGRVHHAPRHHHHHHHSHRHAGWVAAGIVGGAILGNAIVNTINPRPVVVASSTPVVVSQPAPVVVQSTPVVVTPPAPVYQTQNVWVDGRYVDQVQANGTVIRVWQPGHYEQRTVQVQ